MPIPLTPDDSSYPSEFIAPDDGDFVDGASVQQTAQPLADAVAWLKAQVEFTQGQIYGLGASVKFYRFPAVPMVPSAGLGGGAPAYSFASNLAGGSGPSLYVTRTGISTDYVPFALPVGNFRGKLHSVYAQVRGASGHGALPANMPEIQLTRDNPDGTSTDLVSAADTSGTVGAYEAWHFISTLVDDTLHIGAVGGDPRGYTIWVQNESGANAAAGFAIGSFFVGIVEE